MSVNKEKYKIAVTGGIASGKTTFSEMLVRRGYKVYSADKIYEELLLDEEIAKKCSDILGILPKYTDGMATFDRKAAAKVVFDDDVLRKKLNDYTHALVYKRIDEIFSSEREKFVFFEIPLLFESGKEGDFDLVIILLRDRSDRIRSVIERDKKDRELAEKIISSQFDYNKDILSKHTIICNDGDISSLSDKVDRFVGYLEKTF